MYYPPCETLNILKKIALLCNFFSFPPRLYVSSLFYSVPRKWRHFPKYSPFFETCCPRVQFCIFLIDENPFFLIIFAN